MCKRSLSFVLLVWLVGVLHAQTSEQFCRPPSLDHGYVFPYQSAFRHGADLSYACDNGHKPAVEGWWATVTCQDGKWSHEAKCIDENACLPPTIPNGGYVKNSEGWYAQRTELVITCNKGYKQKGPGTSVMCVDGRWTALPVCEESEDACGEPPHVPHALIINEEYQTVFAADSQLQYQCKDGYRTETRATKKTIRCEYGNWSRGPTCTRPSRPDSGTNERDTDRSFTTIDRCGQIPIVQNGAIVDTEPSYFTYKCAAYYTRVGSDTVKCYSNGSWSQEATCKGPSRPDSGTNERDTDRSFTTIDRCGQIPIVQNGAIVDTEPSYFTYKCAAYYTRVGSDTVKCYSNGSWSQEATCKASYCTVDTAQYRALKNVGQTYIEDGETKTLECVTGRWDWKKYSVVHCRDRIPRRTQCCTEDYHHYNYCGLWTD